MLLVGAPLRTQSGKLYEACGGMSRTRAHALHAFWSPTRLYLSAGHVYSVGAREAGLPVQQEHPCMRVGHVGTLRAEGGS